MVNYTVYFADVLSVFSLGVFFRCSLSVFSLGFFSWCSLSVLSLLLQVLNTASTKDAALTLDVVVVGPVVAAARESLGKNFVPCSTDYWSFTQPNRAIPFDLFLLSVGVLLSLVADVKNRFPPNFVKLVCSAMSFLFGDNAATKTSTYTLAADATVKIDVLDPTAGA